MVVAGSISSTLDYTHLKDKKVHQLMLELASTEGSIMFAMASTERESK